MVKKVETIIPPINATAMETRLVAEGPIESAGGIAAAMVAKEVMRIGRSLIGQASRRAFLADDSPPARIFFVKSIRRWNFS